MKTRIPLKLAVRILATSVMAGMFCPGSAWCEEEKPRELPVRGALAELTRARKAADQGDSAAYLMHAKKALASSPRHPYFLLAVARGHAMAGDPSQALRVLSDLADLGTVADVGSGEPWNVLEQGDELRSVTRRLQANRQPMLSGEVVATVDDPRLFPEGIAYDPVTKAFFLSSLKKSKIVRIDAEGHQRDFVTSGRDGLYPTLGMKVDAGHRGLWAVAMRSLIVIQNSPFLNNRIARFFLNEAGDRAERVDVLHAGLRGTRLPYTGVLVGERFYFNATGPLDAMEVENPEPSMIVKIDLSGSLE